MSEQSSATNVRRIGATLARAWCSDRALAAVRRACQAAHQGRCTDADMKRTVKIERHCYACEDAKQPPRFVRRIPGIIYDPQIQMPGTPTLRGHRLSADMIVRYSQANGIDDMVHDYRLKRQDVLIAFWWAGQWGPRRYRKYREWAEAAQHHFWHGCINVPDPIVP